MVIKDFKGLKYKSTDLIPIKDYIDKYHPGLSLPALKKPIEEDELDIVQPCKERFVILNKKALNYVPRRHFKRGTT